MKILTAILIALIIVCIALILKVVLLRRAFDELTENIDDQIRGGTQVPVTLTTGDKHARATAEKLNKELLTLQEQRNEYLSGSNRLTEAVTGISHDIRTPLTAINSYLDLLDEEPDEQVRAKYLERIKDRTLSLSGLADELFRYSTSADPARYTSGSAETVITPIDICRTMEECILSFYAAFKEKGMEPHIDLPDHPVYVLCDPKSANRIIENIISNALKYSDGSIEITLGDQGTAVFANPASDLTPVSAAKLFDRYYTVNEGSNSTGLGFSIAKELITRNNGTIEADYRDGNLIITVRFRQSTSEK